MGVRKIALETRQTDTMVGGSGAADRHHGGRLLRSRLCPGLATPTAWFGLAVQKKAGVGIYYRYAMHKYFI